MIKVNGVELPTPDSYTPGIMDINKMERNANGGMIGERIATKRKIELGWGILNGEEMSLIQNLVAPLFFSVNYFDPKDNAMKTGIFYAGDRIAPMTSFSNGKPTYKGFKFNLIER